MSNTSFDYRLLSFHTEDKVVKCHSDEWAKECQREYIIQMFGVNEKGETASIFVTGYQPFFYIKVPDDWNNQKKQSFIGEIKSKIGKYYENSIIDGGLRKRKTLYGFDAGKLHTFIKIRFKNEATMRKVKALWYKSTKERGYHLKEEGFEFENTSTRLYEANIPPLLRMFHKQGISPSGWIRLPKIKGRNGMKKMARGKHLTSCKDEFSVHFEIIEPLTKVETQVPYKIASFDIEASSSHGDFPLAKKDYKKLATNIIDLWETTEEKQVAENILRKYICTAFKIEGHNEEGIDLVYPQRGYDPEQLDIDFNNWLKMQPALYSKIIEDNVENYSDDENECDEGENNADVEETGKGWMYKKKLKAYKKKRYYYRFIK